MPTTTVTISGNVADLVGDAFAGRTIRVLVESSEPLSVGTVSGGVRLNPYYPASIDANGDLEVEVPVTSGGSPLYQLRFEGQSGAEVRRESLGWFDMTVDDTLEGIRDRTFTPIAVTPTLVADVTAAAASVMREQTNGVAGLDGTGKLYASRIPTSVTTTNGARPVGKGELTFNVVDYGAVPGGTGDDTAAFQAAVDAAAATSTTGGEVFIPVGEFHITNVIVPDRVNIRGAGQRASKVTCTATGAALQVGQKTTLSDFYLTGTTIAGGVGVSFRTNSLHTTLRNMSITGHVTGVKIDNSFVIQISDTQIQACTTGLHITGTVGCNIVRVAGGEVQGCTNGVVIDGANNYGLKFLGTTVEGNSSKGFAVNGATYSLTIRDCYTEGNVAGHIFFAGSGHFGPVIDGCILTGAAAYGVYSDTVPVRDATITNNTFGMTTVASRNVRIGSGGQVVKVANSHTIAGTAGVAFDPSVDYLGTRLIHEHIGRLTLRASAATASAGGAPFAIPHGTAPTNPNNGEMWTTTAGLYVRINGTTVGPLT